MTQSDTAIILAVVSAIISVVLAVISFYNSKKLEKLKITLKENQSQRDAKRDYEYEAKKRLYQDYEPLYFQYLELGDIASSRIEGIAKTTKEGHLNNLAWVKFESYFLYSTIYKLIAPLAIFKLVQEKLTNVDFRIDQNIFIEYELMKINYLSFQEDFKFARAADDIEYLEKWKLRFHGKFDGQGIKLGELDNICELFRKEDKIISFGEYQRKLKDENFKEAIKPLEDRMIGFNPKSDLIFWYMLLSQTIVHSLLRKTRNERVLTEDTLGKLINEFSKENINDLAINDEKDVNEEYIGYAKKYLKRRIEKMFENK
jgi:hypothetical protein